MPLVALTVTSNHQDGFRAHHLRDSYTQALIAAGVIPVLVPSDLTTDALRVVYEHVDGVLLPGGGDLHPAYLGISDTDPQAALAVEIDKPRDQTEITLIRWAYKDDKPLLGICRGHQMINAALGGSLIMDIPTSIGTEVTHKVADWKARTHELLHTVDVCPGTRLAEIFSAGLLPVNSIHHQGVDRTADGLQPTAYAPDGVIEGIEALDARFFIGVQWHPEAIFASTSPQMLKLFQAFAAAMQ